MIFLVLLLAVHAVEDSGSSSPALSDTHENPPPSTPPAVAGAAGGEDTSSPHQRKRRHCPRRTVDHTETAEEAAGEGCPKRRSLSAALESELDIGVVNGKHAITIVDMTGDECTFHWDSSAWQKHLMSVDEPLTLDQSQKREFKSLRTYIASELGVPEDAQDIYHETLAEPLEHASLALLLTGPTLSIYLVARPAPPNVYVEDSPEKKWVASITHRGVNVRLGRYDNEEHAVQAVRLVEERLRRLPARAPDRSGSPARRMAEIYRAVFGTALPPDIPPPPATPVQFIIRVHALDGRCCSLVYDPAAGGSIIRRGRFGRLQALIKKKLGVPVKRQRLHRASILEGQCYSGQQFHRALALRDRLYSAEPLSLDDFAAIPERPVMLLYLVPTPKSLGIGHQATEWLFGE